MMMMMMMLDGTVPGTTCCGVEMRLYLFLATVINTGEWVGSHSDHFTHVVHALGIHLMGI
jgi:hypothetical protein